MDVLRHIHWTQSYYKYIDCRTSAMDTFPHVDDGLDGLGTAGMEASGGHVELV